MTQYRVVVVLALSLTAGVLFLPGAASLRVLAQAPRDQAREPVGTGTIGGVVVDAAGDHRPLRRAQVTLRGGALVSPRIIATDEAGRFAFDDLPASTYTLMVMKAGYVTSFYGASRAGRPGLSIALAEGARKTDLAIAIPKGAVITGTITDERGAVIEDAFITLLQRQVVDGTRRFVDTYQAAYTDARGVYRIYGLGAGEYVLLVSRSELSRRPTDFLPIAEGEIDLALAAARAGTPPPAPPRPRPFGYAPTYFPNATSVADASPINVQPGDERTIDVSLHMSPVSQVSGTVAMPDGTPAGNVQISLLPVGTVSEAASRAYAPGGQLAARRTSPAGAFSFSGIPAGAYELTALAIEAPSRSGPPRGAAGPAAAMWAETPVILGGDDQSVTMTLQPTLTMTGRVVFDGTSLPPANAADTRVSLLSTDPPVITDLDTRGVTGTVAPDGQFRIAGILPGSFHLEVSAPGASSTSGWAIASATIKGVDGLESPVDVHAGDDLSNVVLRFTDTPSTLRGTLQTPAGAPATDYVVVVFSQDRSFWRAHSRRIAGVRPDTSGAFNFRNLPAGDYYIAAVTDAETGEWFDPAFLEPLVPASLKVVIRNGQVTTQSIRVRGEL